jgi:hypothetical protein
MDEDIITSRAKLIEAYLFDNGFCARSDEQDEQSYISMKVGKQRIPKRSS